MRPEEIEERIKEIFRQNYEMLKFEGGHTLQENVKEAALNHVLYYYRRLRDIAEQVTETEVKLTLPNQRTREGRPFTIEGVVDIVREGEEVWMYDIKTHDPNYIASHKDLYERQLDVYAYIFENLRGEQLDHTAIISTAIPKALQEAILEGDEAKIEEEVEKWEPLIELPYDYKKVEETVSDFSDVVDKIESGCFEEVPVERLKEKVGGVGKLFATHVCRNCDVRFSCSSYRKYAQEKNGGFYSTYMKYYKEDEDELEKEQYRESSMNMEKVDELADIEETIEGIVKPDEMEKEE